MSSGLPVLGSRVSGNEDFIVEGRTGWIFTPGDEDSYVDALRRACDASQEAMATMSAQALAMVQSRASIRHVGDSLIRLYGRGLGEPASQH
ncbi:glycosyltransferase family 4 protein [Piscinibacter aquaticus]|uniref:Glycosyltransferase family 4 protein n=1 Tax=Piscinibacter aquaticus TaxID=392597 RepID=A0A5C6U0F6_9BURK|nr:glycosyltransferase family 4 protein [Piscinibacter aquaticus]